MGEIPNFRDTPPDMEQQALRELRKIDPNAERELLSGYDGEEAVHKEKLLRDILGKIYAEGYVAGALGQIPYDTSQWNVTVIENDEGEEHA